MDQTGEYGNLFDGIDDEFMGNEKLDGNCNFEKYSIAHCPHVGKEGHTLECDCILCNHHRFEHLNKFLKTIGPCKCSACSSKEPCSCMECSGKRDRLYITGILYKGMQYFYKGKLEDSDLPDEIKLAFKKD